MKELQDEGKIRYIGLSEATEDEIRRASKVAKIDALQIEVRAPSYLQRRALVDCCIACRAALALDARRASIEPSATSSAETR